MCSSYLRPMEEASQSPHHSRKKKKSKKADVLFDFVPAKEGHACPFVGYFPSGFDPLQCIEEKGKGAEAGSLKVCAFQNVEKYKSRLHQLVVTPPDSNVDFVGTNHLGEGAMWQPGNYALGVFDKDSLTLQLLPLSGTKVLRMEPRVRGLGYDVESLSGIPEVEMSKDLMLQKRNLLTSTFGTHKSRIMQSRLERGRVKDDALGDKEIGRLFQKAGENVSVPTSEEALQQANAAIKRNIPPHDTTATTPDRAYVFDEIIMPEEQSSLNDLELLKSAIGKRDKVNELRKEKAYPEFVLKRLHSMNTFQDEHKARGVVILSYMRHLLAFYSLPRRVINSIVDPMGALGDLESSKNAIDLRSYANIPAAVVAKILRLFTSVNQGAASESEVRTQTAEKRDLLMSYILVLGLMIDNFCADPYDLAVEMRKSISNLKPYYMELGCKLKPVKAADRGDVDPRSAQRLYEVHLPLPLQFPTLQNKIRKRTR